MRERDEETELGLQFIERETERESEGQRFSFFNDPPAKIARKPALFPLHPGDSARWTQRKTKGRDRETERESIFH